MLSSHHRLATEFAKFIERWTAWKLELNFFQIRQYEFLRVFNRMRSDFSRDLTAGMLIGRSFPSLSSSSKTVISP